MTLLPHKLTFQLTPLLDLLLIVIFAQFMDVQNTTRQTERAAADRIADVERDRQDVQQAWNTLNSEHAQSLERLSETQQQMNELREEHARLQQNFGKQITEVKEELKLAIQQRDLIGDLIAEVFQVPDRVIEQVLKPHGKEGTLRSPEEVESLRTVFRNIAQKRGYDVVKHLLTFEELRKRCDIWELYIAENGLIDFNPGHKTFSFRAGTSEAFQSELFARYKSLPQPKSLVIILLSWGDATAAPREAVLHGLPRVTDHMRADSNGQTRFEYANLGYNPKGLTASEP